MELLRYAIITAAAAMLLLALFPVRRLLTELPGGAMRRGWHWLAALLVVLIGTYITYAFGLHTQQPIAEELLTPVILLAGSWFVVLVSMLSAGTIASLRRLAELEQETITDALTGIFNRRYLDRKLKSEVERARRYNLPMALMLIDVDNFKGVNDHHGHAAGDLVLARIAECIQNVSRSNDIVARYGGEEIAVIVPASRLVQARAQAERLRTAIAAMDVPLGSHHRSAAVRATVSIGVSLLRLDDEAPIASLWSRVDQALYLAKSNGRNQVVSVPAIIHDRVTDLQTWQQQRANAAVAAHVA